MCNPFYPRFLFLSAPIAAIGDDFGKITSSFCTVGRSKSSSPDRRNPIHDQPTVGCP